MTSVEPPAGASISYRRQYRRCGKPRCPTCGREGSPGHGPYWYAYWWQDGRMRSRYVGKQLPAGATAETSVPPTPATPPSPRMLRVRTLGAFAVWRGDEAIPADGWGRRKVALLFKCLLSAPGYRLHREQLLEWLWPEAEPQAATRNLHSTLHRLRRLLDAGATSGSHVQLEGEVVALLPAVGEGASGDWLDATAFAQAAGVALAGRDLTACRAALARYGGEYLPEEPYEDWAVARREELRAQHLALLEHLAGLSLAAGERGEAERCLRAVLAREPTDERAVRRLMRLLTETGRRAEALRVYQALAAALREELGVAPDNRTEALNAGLLAQEQTLPTDDHGSPGAAPPLPGGTLTLLLTDIVGSVALWERYPAAMPLALRRHEALLAASLAEQSGRLVKGQGEGDSAFAVFTSPTAALAAACALQQALLAEPWPDGLVLRVRMALHAGEAHPHEGEYVGAAVNRCARLRGLAHGGQILLSQAAADLVRDVLPEGVGLRPLGTFQLRGLERAEPVYQVLHPRLPADFPPPPASKARRGNLPAPLTGLIGREGAVEEVRDLLATTRLLTLTGAGGIGKTRLALAVAGELESMYPDGVWLVELASLTEPHLVPQAVARALGLREDSGNVPGRPLLDTLAEYVRDRELLLVLDNCEHLLEVSAEMAASMLAAAPRLHILATSREVLGVAGEVTWQVPPLGVPRAVPTPDTDLGSYPTVQLFVTRAQAVRPGFRLTAANASAVAAICRRLDGLPLAIELAAARVGVLGVAALAARLDDRFQLLTGGSRTAPTRHQTLRAAIDWSYGLLSEAERLLLQRLAVFAGGWTLEAAEAVCAGGGLEPAAVLDLLARLVARSLVQVGEQGEAVRYAFLETVRQYALEQLATAGEEQSLRQAHAHYYLALAERSDAALRGPEQAAWLDCLEAEHDNLLAALAWCLGERQDPESGRRLAQALDRFWYVRAYLSEARRWLEAALAQSDSAPPDVRARLLYAVAGHAVEQGDGAAALAWWTESLAMFRTLGDVVGCGHTLNGLAILAYQQGEYARARECYEESLALYRQEGRGRDAATVLHNLGMLLQEQGDHRRARTLYEESLSLYRQAGDEMGLGMVLCSLGRVLLLHGDADQAISRLEEGLEVRRKLNDRSGIAWSLSNLGDLALRQQDLGSALSRHEESLALFRQIGEKRGIAIALSKLADAMLRQGKPAEATARAEESLAVSREIGFTSGMAAALAALGRVARAEGDLTRAAVCFADALARYKDLDAREGVAECLEDLAMAASAKGQADRLVRLLSAAAAVRHAIGVPPIAADHACYERVVTDARVSLGEDAFARAWAAGQALSLERAVALALADEESG